MNSSEFQYLLKCLLTIWVCTSINCFPIYSLNYLVSQKFPAWQFVRALCILQIFILCVSGISSPVYCSSIACVDGIFVNYTKFLLFIESNMLTFLYSLKVFFIWLHTWYPILFCNICHFHYIYIFNLSRLYLYGTW